MIEADRLIASGSTMAEEVADRAIRQGKNVELNVASFLTLTATTPATTGREPHSAAVPSPVGKQE